ncbi:MAG: response regulator [Candidatus Riflebacteria bacterium]|nr:response regulator [Candidatus Riflebacteria bacterium]
MIDFNVVADRILIIEDDREVQDFLASALRHEGFDVTVGNDGEEGLRLARKLKPDLVLLDLMLPKVDGMEVCRQLKWDPATRSIPVVMATARIDEIDAVLGLEMGAEDYIRKPFGVRELLARVRTALRKRPPAGDDPSGETPPKRTLIVAAERGEALLDGELLNLTPTELQLLQVLIAPPASALTRAELDSRLSAAGHHLRIGYRFVDRQRSRSA